MKFFCISSVRVSKLARREARHFLFVYVIDVSKRMQTMNIPLECVNDEICFDSMEKFQSQTKNRTKYFSRCRPSTTTTTTIRERNIVESECELCLCKYFLLRARIYIFARSIFFLVQFPFSSIRRMLPQRFAPRRQKRFNDKS